MHKDSIQGKGSYDVKEYWETRLRTHRNLTGVGFKNFSEYYNRWVYRMKKVAIERHLRDVDLKGKHVLDVGCGIGFFVQWFLDKGANVHGLDISDFVIDEIRKKFTGPTFEVSDISSPDYSPGRKFDIINLWDVIYHQVEEEKFKQSLSNMAASSSKGALMLITDQFGAKADIHSSSHVTYRCLETYKRVMPSLGFKLRSSAPIFRSLGLYHPLIGPVNRYMGPFFYLLDRFNKKVPDDNISLTIWEYTK